MSPPDTIRALTLLGPGRALITWVPLPRLRNEYLLVRVRAVAINPADWKHIHMAETDYSSVEPGKRPRVGCDFAGVVEAVGPQAVASSGREFVPGDRVCGFCHGSNEAQVEDGCFAEYAVVKAGLAIRIPKWMTDEQAATVGVGLTTVAQGLYQAFKLPLPPVSSSTTSTLLLIHGGSTATGILGIQFACLSGCCVVATSSPHNFDYLRSLGASAVFDYADENACVAAVRKWAALQRKPLRKAWDCIASPETARLCVRTLADDEQGGEYRSLLPVQDEVIQAVNGRVSNGVTLAYSATGEDFELGARGWKFEGKREDYEFAKKFWGRSEQLFSEGKVKAVRQHVNRGGKGGLEGVLVGLQELKAGKVSGGKLVYTMETRQGGQDPKGFGLCINWV